MKNRFFVTYFNDFTLKTKQISQFLIQFLIQILSNTKLNSLEYEW